ncbi:hypothetical protein KW486_17145 [Vibrio fluvialis]|nr:hypothetical protein [Vibrio fluvialis]MBY8052212.1 hypothetical protein [Vibrio fluvialis]
MKKGFINFIGMYTIKIANMLIPLLYIPIASKNLPTEQVDMLFLFLSVVAFGYIITDFAGILTGVSYFDAKGKSNDKQNYFDILNFKLILSIFVSLASALYIYKISEINIWILLIFFFFNYVGYVLYSTWYLMLKNDIIKNSIMIFLARIAPFLIITIFNGSVVFYIFSISICYFSFSVLEFIRVRRKYALKKQGRVNFFDYPKFTYKTFIADTMPNLYNNVPIIIIPAIYGPIGFSLFFIANRVSGFFVQFSSIFTKSFLTVVDGKVKYKVFLLYLSVVSLLLLITYWLSYDITSIIASSEMYNEKFFFFLLLSAFPVCVLSFINNLILIPNNLFKVYEVANIFGSIIFGLLSIFSAIFLGLEWLPITLCLSRFGILFFVLYVGRNEIIENFM